MGEPTTFLIGAGEGLRARANAAEATKRKHGYQDPRTGLHWAEKSGLRMYAGLNADGTPGPALEAMREEQAALNARMARVERQSAEERKLDAAAIAQARADLFPHMVDAEEVEE